MVVIKQVEMKEKNVKRVSRMNKKTMLCQRNLIKGVKNLGCSFNLGPFLKIQREDHRLMDQRTRKLMAMHEAKHPRDSIDRIYAPRKEEKGFASTEDNVYALQEGLKTYIKKRKER